MKLNLKLILTLLLFFGITTVYSQWYYSAALSGEYDSNPFRAPEEEYDYISQFSLGLQRDFGNLSFTYSGSYGRFELNNARNFYWHSLKMMYGSDTTLFSIGATNRINRADYNIYDYISGNAGLYHKQYAGGFLFRLGGSMELNNFRYLSELNNMLFSASASINRSFPTRTSFIAGLGVNYKQYLNSSTTTSVQTADTSGILSSIATIDGFGPGGGGYGGGSSGGMGGSGMGSSPGQIWISNSNAKNPSVTQLTLSLRLAQSLSTTTGLALQFYDRISISNTDRSIAGLIGYQDESQVFDDPMGYEGQSYGAELTQVLPWRMMAKTSFYNVSKNYLSQGIYPDAETYDAAIMRVDTYRTVWATISKQFMFPFGEGIVNWQLSYQWIDNGSNSYWYNYSSNNVTMGFQFEF